MNARAPKPAVRKTRRTEPDGRVRAVIDRVTPEIDGGRFSVKRIQGERMAVEAHVFADGHDVLAAVLRYRHESDGDWRESAMTAFPNDVWRGEFTVEKLGRYRYAVTAWVDHFLSWANELKRRVDPADIASAALVGAKLIAEAANRAANAGASNDDAQRLRDWGKQLVGAKDTEDIKRIALDDDMGAI